MKIELIAELLQRNSHDVEILSPGEVVERQLKLYPAFSEQKPFHAKIPVYYSSALPVRFLNGLWSSLSTLRIFKARHRVAPFDVVLIYNLKPPQVICARHAIRSLTLPVILEYEDNAFVADGASDNSGFTSIYYLSEAKRLLNSISGCMAVSPYLLSQTRSSIPKLLLRGVVSEHIVNGNQQASGLRKNWVVFSGTLERSQGLEQLVRAWGMLALSGWELHIAGQGPITSALEKIAVNNPSIVFDGLLNREENARLLCTGKIGMNPQDLSQIPGNVFAFKIIEYLGAGLHVITTPRGTLEPELEAGISYIADNSPGTIAACLKKVIDDRRYERNATQAALQAYGPGAVSKALNRLIEQAKAPVS